MEQLKKQVGYASVDYIEDGMTVGLGTGSTAYYMVERLGEKIQAGDLNIQAVTTSQRTAAQAQALGIPLVSLNQADRIDLTIDGADEVDPQLNGIKGGGGAHLIEKMVAYHSDRVIWIVDDSKLVDQLGAFPLPVEVIPSGYVPLQDHFNREDEIAQLRLNDQGAPFTTDHGNYILDLHLGQISHPQALAQELEALPGVVEHGLFLGLCDLVLVGQAGQVKTLHRQN